MKSLIAAAALLLCAAAPAFADPVPPPTPDDVAVHIGADKNGLSVSASAGDRVAIELTGSPSTGASWIVTARPDFIDAPQFITGPTTDAQQRSGFVGGDRWQVYVFEVTGSGSGTITLEKRSPATRSGPPLDTFSVKIEAP